jgi:hypothetical protein
LIFHGSPAELLAELKGRVWQARVEEALLPQLKLTCLVTGLSHTAAGLEARLITEDPESAPGVLEATPSEPGLEDAYIWKMGSGVVAEVGT